MLTCRTIFPGESNVANANTCFLQVRLTVSIVVTTRTTSRFRAAHGGIYYLQRLFEIIHMCPVWNLSYAASEARVIKFRILNLWIFDTSDLQWPETVQVTAGKTLTLGYHGCLDLMHEYVVASLVLALFRHNRGTRDKNYQKGLCMR